MQSFLNFAPQNIEYYKLALTNKGIGKKNKDGTPLNNERLEFLGDSILDAIVAHLLYQKFPQHNEGILTETKSRMVKREMLNNIATKMSIQDLAYHINKKELEGNNTCGNTLEALIGAIYLDKGYNTAQIFVERQMIQKYMEIEVLINKDENFKSQLLEWGQKHKIKIEFQMLDERITETHQSQFRSEVLIDDEVFEIGMGSSKKESEQNASKHALTRIQKKEQFYLEKFTQLD